MPHDFVIPLAIISSIGAFLVQLVLVYLAGGPKAYRDQLFGRMNPDNPRQVSQLYDALEKEKERRKNSPKQ